MFKQKIQNLDSRTRLMADILFEDLSSNRRKVTVGKREFDTTTLKGLKKFLKHQYKIEYYIGQERKFPFDFINKFTHAPEHGESYTNVWIFKNLPETMDKIKMHFNLEGESNYYDYSPTGLWFASPAEVLVYEERIILIQSHHLDC